MKPTLLYRRSLMPPEELEAAGQYFELTDTMVGVRNRRVVGRYSVLPFYEEVAAGLLLQGSKLVNTPRAHHYIADFEYYHDIAGLTPRTYFRLEDVPKRGGPFVVKGCTNSKKHEWASKMFAETYDDAVRIACDLGTDMLLGQQQMLVREYVPLKTLEIGLNGLPFANEWRCFFYGRKLLSTGFYWTEAEQRGKFTAGGLEVAYTAARQIARTATFFTVDVAEAASGDWIVIEVNDGQMAGLSENDPERFYSTLASAMKR